MDGVSMDIILLRAVKYEMDGEIAGEKVSGYSCWYYNADNLNPVVDEYGGKGLKPEKFSLPVEKGSQIQSVPGIYKAYLKIVPGKLKIDGLEFVSLVM